MKIKSILSILVFCFASSFVFAQLNMELVGQLDYEDRVNDVWGYAAPDGTEYAFVGTQRGLSIVSLADPANPEELFFIEGSTTTWRDIKTWEETAYAVCDACPDGLTVIDLSDLPNSAPHFFWSDVPGEGLKSAHNIFIDEFGYGYLAGTSEEGGQTIYIDCFSTPGMPQFVAFGPEPYAHDIYVRDNLMYASEIYEGAFAIYDVSDKSNSILLASQETPSAFTHNAWLSDDGNTLFTTDEKPFGSTTSYDISDYDNIQLLDRYFSEASIGEATIPHNVHVLNDYLIISHYTDGCVIVDAQRPDNLVEVGNYDTYLPDNVGFFGDWGAYPFSPSGLILISDRQTGLYVVEPSYKRASYLEGTVTDAVTGASINNTFIEILETGRSTTSNGFGDYKTGIEEAGVFEVLARAIFYEDQIVEATFVNGQVTILNIEMTPLEAITLEGQVNNKAGAGIPNAVVELNSEFYEYNATADANGAFSIENFYSSDYELIGGKWGFKTNLSNRKIDGNGTEILIELEEGYEDNFLLDLGWTVSGEPDKGDWVREVPEGAFLVGNTVSVYLSPNLDVPEDEGNYCLVTGNGGEINSVSLQGLTRIVSPTVDMTNWNNPLASFYYWFASFEGAVLGSPVAGEAYLDFKMYNGKDTVLIERFDSNPIEFPEWKEETFKILDYISLSSEMEFIFEATGVRLQDFDEAAVDFFRTWDSNPDGSQNLHLVSDFTAWPNPFIDNFTIRYDIGALANAELIIYDMLGKKIWSDKLLTTRGTIELGAGFAPGAYFVEIRCDEGTESIRIVKGQ